MAAGPAPPVPEVRGGFRRATPMTNKHLTSPPLGTLAANSHILHAYMFVIVRIYVFIQVLGFEIGQLRLG